jgi:hypothetical protein
MTRAFGIIRVNRAFRSPAGNQRPPVRLHADIPYGARVRLQHLQHLCGTELPVQQSETTYNRPINE